MNELIEPSDEAPRRCHFDSCLEDRGCGSFHTPRQVVSNVFTRKPQ